MAVSENTSVISKVSYKILINLGGGREKSRSRREFWSGCSGTVVALKNYSTSHVLATIKIPLNPTIDCKVCAVVRFLTAKHKSAQVELCAWRRCYDKTNGFSLHLSFIEGRGSTLLPSTSWI